MQQLILKNNLDQSKIDALLYFLKSWNIEAEFKNSSDLISKKKKSFSLSVGLWKDYNIEAEDLRKKAWNRSI